MQLVRRGLQISGDLGLFDLRHLVASTRENNWMEDDTQVDTG
jgi:hypothetical protein